MRIENIVRDYKMSLLSLIDHYNNTVSRDFIEVLSIDKEAGLAYRLKKPADYSDLTGKALWAKLVSDGLLSNSNGSLLDTGRHVLTMRDSDGLTLYYLRTLQGRFENDTLDENLTLDDIIERTVEQWSSTLDYIVRSYEEV